MLRRQLVLSFALAHTAFAQPAPDEPPPPPPPQPQPQPEPPKPEPPKVDPTDRDACLTRRHDQVMKAQQLADLHERTRLLQSLPDCSNAGEAAAAAIAPPIVMGEEAQPEIPTGFAIEVRMETGQTIVDNDFVLPGTQAGIFLGRRGEDVTFGLGFELGRISESSGSNDSSATSILVIPGLRAVMARTADRRTELLGQIDVGYGATFYSEHDDTISHLRVQLGPSLRHWITPSFAIGGTVGPRYDSLSRSHDDGLGGTTEASISFTALFSSVQMTGVF